VHCKATDTATAAPAAAPASGPAAAGTALGVAGVEVVVALVGVARGVGTANKRDVECESHAMALHLQGGSGVHAPRAPSRTDAVHDAADNRRRVSLGA